MVRGASVPRAFPPGESHAERQAATFLRWACVIDQRRQEFATEPHHPRTVGKDGPGAGQKAPDRDAIPLCGFGHHRGEAPGYISIHKNPIEFRQRYGTEAEIRDAVLADLERTTP